MAEGFDRSNGLSSDRIICHIIDSQGNLWLGTEKGLSVHDGSGWIKVERIDDVGLGTSKAIGTVKMIWEDEGGNIWVAAEKNLFIFTGNYWIDYDDRILEDFTATRFLQDSRGEIWICSEYMDKKNKTETYLSVSIIQGTLTKFDGKSWMSFNMEVGGNHLVDRGDPIRYYSALLEDSQGRIWIGCAGGVHLYNGITWQTFDVSTLAGDYVHFIYEDSRHDIWVGTKSGVSRFHDGSWISYSRKDMDGNNAMDVFEDRQGNIWISVWGNVQMQGLAMFDGESWVYFDSKSGLPSGNLSVLTVDSTGQVWAMSRTGISLFREGNWNLLNKNTGPDGKKFSAFLVSRDGKVWIASDEGIFSFDGTRWQHRYQVPGQMKGWQVSAMIEDEAGRIWAGTEKNGVLVLDGDSEHSVTTGSGLIRDDVKEIFTDPRGNLWLISREGISRIRQLP